MNVTAQELKMLIETVAANGGNYLRIGDVEVQLNSKRGGSTARPARPDSPQAEIQQLAEEFDAWQNLEAPADFNPFADKANE